MSTIRLNSSSSTLLVSFMILVLVLTSSSLQLTLQQQFNVQQVHSNTIKQQEYCMPPISSYKQDVYAIVNNRNNLNSFTYQSIIKYDTIKGLKRVDTYDSNSKILTIEYIQIDFTNNNITYIYKYEENQCTCLNVGTSNNINQVFNQCIKVNFINNINIANLKSLKVGFNNTNNLNIYNIVPFNNNNLINYNNLNSNNNNNYWWIISENEYTNQDSVNELISTTYYDHEFNNINTNDFKLPSICPPKDHCVHPR